MTTTIEWTNQPGTKGEVWNPTIGCSKVSEGCRNCYAERMANRLAGMANQWANGQGKGGGLAGYLNVVNQSGKWSGNVLCLPDRLSIPLKWTKPRTVFVNSMSDLFHGDVPFEFIDRVFAGMALCPQHTFIVLTKRPERMIEWYEKENNTLNPTTELRVGTYACYDWTHLGRGIGRGNVLTWPLPNVWLGTSIEDQSTADQRIPHLLRCPAAVRVLSLEPLLGPVDLSPCFNGQHDAKSGTEKRRIDWVIVGGESGPGARPCNVQWIRSIVGQCQAAGVPCFVKQLGAKQVCGCGGDIAAWAKNHGERRAECARCGMVLPLRDPKGGDPSEWPADLRVRQWPTTTDRQDNQ